jgi:O-antigen/teichoic acid export membrane protein
MLSTAFVLLLLLVWAWTGPHDATTTWLLTILAVHIFGIATIELTSAKFQLEGRHGRLASLQFTPHLLRFVSIISLVFVQGTAELQTIHVAIVFASVAIIILLFGGYQIRLMVKGQLMLEGHSTLSTNVNLNLTKKPGPWEVMSASWPFGMAGVFYLIYFQSDIILIKYLVNESAAGIYSVAFVVMNAVYLFPSVLYQKFLLPKLHRWAHHNQGQLHRVYRIGNITMLGLGLTAMVLLWLVVPVVLPKLFGAEYQGAVMLLMILSVAAPFRFVANSVGAVLTTRNHMRMKVRLMGMGALINIVLNFSLIPIFGAAGAAVATVTTEALIMVMYFWYYRNSISSFDTID